MRGCGGGCGTATPAAWGRSDGVSGNPRWPRRPPRRGKDGETGLSSLRTSETNFYLIASLKNKTSAVPPRRFLPVEEMEIAEKPPLLHSSISAVTHA